MDIEDINYNNDFSKDAILLVEKKFHKIYWVGSTTNNVLRNNIYLIKDKNEGIIIDCGSRYDFKSTLQRVKQVMSIYNITKLFVNHQDPDVSSGIIDWLDLNPNIEIITSPNINILIQHYITEHKEYKFYNTQKYPYLKLSSGAILEFIPSPFMHSPGAVTLYDSYTKTLFSGDIWAAITINWKLVLEDDFNEHIEDMDFFHKNYIANNIASRNFLINFKDRVIETIMPQHGSILAKKHIKSAFQYLKDLKSGTDNFKYISDKELSFIDNL